MLINMQKYGCFTQIKFCRELQQNQKPQQEPEDTSLIARVKSQLRIEVATRIYSPQVIPGHDTTKTSLERKMEGCIKPSRDRKGRLRPEIPKHPAIYVATKEEFLRQGIFKEEYEVATPI